MGKTQPSKKELSEQKKKEEEHAAAQVIIIFKCVLDKCFIKKHIVIKHYLISQAFEEFVQTFQNEGKKTSKVWVKAGTYDAGKRRKT